MTISTASIATDNSIPANSATVGSLLIVEDDRPFLERLARGMESRGFAVTTAQSVAEGLAQSLLIGTDEHKQAVEEARWRR